MHHEADFTSAPGHYGDDNRRYHEDEYGHENDRMIKTTSDRFEGGIQGEFQLLLTNFRRLWRIWCYGRFSRII